VQYRAIEETNTIAIGEHVAGHDVVAWLTKAFAELRAAVQTLSARRLGADAALYSSELLEDEHGEVVAFVPIANAAGAVGRAKDMLLPATEYAVAVHHGSFEDLDQTFGALGALGTVVAERAIGVQGPIREDYLAGPLDTPDEAQPRAEVGWPIFQTAPAD
jgi:effector-binding domain-containing protein